jgi:hypothetical protein
MKGPDGGRDPIQRLEADSGVHGGPFSFRADSGGGATQGKPRAMLFWPLRVTG